MPVIFGEPRALLLLAGWILASGVAVTLAERGRRRALQTFGDEGLLGRASALPRGSWRRAAEVIGALAVALGLLALARPQFGETAVILSRTGRDVVFVLDLSRSMNAEDVAPSRLEAAKAAVRTVLEASPGDRVGLVIFGGSAFLQVPLTLDRSAFELFLDAADTDEVSDPGTNLAVALSTAASAFGTETEPRYRAAVVLSDGEGLEGEIGGALAALRRAGVRTFALGIGTPQGAPIPVRAGGRLLGYHRDVGGEVVVTRLDEAALRSVAEATDGSYHAWAGGAGARRLAGDLAGIESREIASRAFVRLAERYQWPAAAALLALLVEGALLALASRRHAARVQGAPVAPGTPVRRRGARGQASAAAMGLAAALTLPAAAAAQDGADAVRLYRDGRFADAYEAFRALREERKEPDPRLAYDTGNALYRLGRYDEAAGSYHEALGSPPDLRRRAYYNLGNALFKGAEAADDPRAGLRQAVSAYEEALVLAPDDIDAKWNLELALRRLAEEEQRRGGGGDGAGREGQDEGGQGEDDGQGGPGAPQQPGQGEPPPRQQAEAADEASGRLTEEQARQLLQAIQDEEGETVRAQDRGRMQIETGRNDW